MSKLRNELFRVVIIEKCSQKCFPHSVTSLSKNMGKPGAHTMRTYTGRSQKSGARSLFLGSHHRQIIHVLQTCRLQIPVLQNYGAIVLTHRGKCSLRPSSWNLLLTATKNHYRKPKQNKDQWSLVQIDIHLNIRHMPKAWSTLKKRR